MSYWWPGSFMESVLYSSIRIQGYRGLDSFRMDGLGRVNLLVGKNNCGKTSIDTGLHYSVMEDMWRMITEQAAELSVQVFATTHSRDCYESLAAIAKPEAGNVTIQRIDRSRGEAVRYNNQAIIAAAERSVEVR